MVTKNEKPSVQVLAHGSVLPGELIDLLKRAVPGAVYTSIEINWIDQHSSRVTDISELAPIEDPTGIANVQAHFSYEDKSKLNISLQNYSDHTVSATGLAARARQSELCEFWASLPGRSRTSALQYEWLNRIGALLQALAVILSIVLLLTFRDTKTYTPAILYGAYVLIAWGFWLYVRSLPFAKAIGHLVVFNRRTSPDIWKVLSGVVSIAGLALAVVAYLYPRT